jgi:type II secretory pathway pseudopilin PulG
VSGQAARDDRVRSAGGFSIVELMFGISIAGTITAIAVPQALHALDEYRTRAAAHYLAMRLAEARVGAIKRSTYVGLRFEAVPDMLAWHFQGVTFGILAGVPDANGVAAGTSDGVRLGSSALLSMNPNGSSSSGTLYMHGRRRAQYAVRVLGETGRIRVLRYDDRRLVWVQQ